MIRPAVVDDLPRLMVLAMEMHRESRFADYPFDEGKVGTLILRLITNPEGTGFAWVAVVGDQVVGGLLATLYESWFSTQLVASDYGLFLHPKHRGGMLAMRLVKQYKAWAKEAGADCELGCNTGVNPDAYDRFVQCMGFRPVARLYTARF
jgi:GNAT superfamily N-acetyltransferase